MISSPALCGCLSSEAGILYRSRDSHKNSITQGKEQKNAEILKGSMREYAEILKGPMRENAEILKETNLTIHVIFGYLAHFRLVIWRSSSLNTTQKGCVISAFSTILNI